MARLSAIFPRRASASRTAPTSRAASKSTRPRHKPPPFNEAIFPLSTGMNRLQPGGPWWHLSKARGSVMPRFAVGLALFLLACSQLDAQQVSTHAREAVQTIRELRAIELPDRSEI